MFEIDFISLATHKLERERNGSSSGTELEDPRYICTAYMSAVHFPYYCSAVGRLSRTLERMQRSVFWKV